MSTLFKSLTQLQITHEKLHELGIPHNCDEFKRVKKVLELEEILTTWPHYLGCYHRGSNN